MLFSKYDCIIVFGDIMDVIEKIKKVIDDLRPFLINDGGNIEYVDFKDGVVYIRMLGACSNCSMIDYTIKEGIEAMLVNEVPEVKEVIQVD